MAKKTSRPGRLAPRKTGPARKVSKNVVPPASNGNAREMAARVKLAFDQGYSGQEKGTVDYEKGDDGVGADQLFFHELIFRSIRRHHGGGDPPTPDPPVPTRDAAKRHGAMVQKIQAHGPIRLVNILSTFYQLKEELCPDPDGRSKLLGKVCNF